MWNTDGTAPPTIGVMILDTNAYGRNSLFDIVLAANDVIGGGCKHGRSAVMETRRQTQSPATHRPILGRLFCFSTTKIWYDEFCNGLVAQLVRAPA